MVFARRCDESDGGGADGTTMVGGNCVAVFGSGSGACSVVEVGAWAVDGVAIEGFPMDGSSE